MCAHMLLNVNNQDFIKTSVRRQTVAVSKDSNSAVVVVDEVRERGM